MVLIVVMKLFA